MNRPNGPSPLQADPSALRPGPSPVHIRQGAYLPHWTRDGAIYSLCFRLADSLPASVVKSWKRERAQLLAQAQITGVRMAPAVQKRFRALFSEHVEKYLDAGHGACWMARPAVAALLQNSLKHFDGTRYRLFAWCIMPNHVHMVAQPMPGHLLKNVVHSWKSYTAHQANELLGRSGAFWQAESYDHIIRDDDDLIHAMEYTLNNPRAAGLENWPYVGCADDISQILFPPPHP